jgi:RIO kinase 1
VIHEVTSGTEATVYCCAAGPTLGVELLAAKLYRSRAHRAFRNDAVYQAGRVILDRRMARAFKNKTRKGREVQHALWIDHEWETLRRLHAVGADVPTPIARTDGALLMSYCGDAEVAAPRLQEVTLRPDEARRLFDRLIRNVELWLAHETIHGDLSAFNVLYWSEAPLVIDFPQACDPRFNTHAYRLLARDVDVRGRVRDDPRRELEVARRQLHRHRTSFARCGAGWPCSRRRSSISCDASPRVCGNSSPERSQRIAASAHIWRAVGGASVRMQRWKQRRGEVSSSLRDRGA